MKIIKQVNQRRSNKIQPATKNNQSAFGDYLNDPLNRLFDLPAAANPYF
jgi:hypothetical protein